MFNETLLFKSIKEATFTEGQKCQDRFVVARAKQRFKKSRENDFWATQRENWE